MASIDPGNTSSPSSSSSTSKVLVIDDDRIVRKILRQMLSELGYETMEAANGEEGLERIQEHWKILDAVLLDRTMPEMDGMEVVARLKKNPDLRWLPIIMVTASDSKKAIQEGIEAGVFYYLIKPVDKETLKPVTVAASREAQRHRALLQELAEHGASFQMVNTCDCELRTMSEARLVASLLANCFPDPARVVSGLAELLYNAVEHGNLGITYDEKTAFINAGTWKTEVDRRADAPANRNKYAYAQFRRTPEGCQVTIKDQGKGFSWRNYLQIDPTRANDNHGRGIAQANIISFDQLRYNDAGNEVTAFSYDQKPS